MIVQFNSFRFFIRKNLWKSIYKKILNIICSFISPITTNVNENIHCETKKCLKSIFKKHKTFKYLRVSWVIITHRLSLDNSDSFFNHVLDGAFDICWSMSSKATCRGTFFNVWVANSYSFFGDVHFRQALKFLIDNVLFSVFFFFFFSFFKVEATKEREKKRLKTLAE